MVDLKHINFVNMMDENEEIGIRLKSGIDINDLPDKGALFEVEESEIENNAKEESTSNTYFAREDVYHNFYDAGDLSDDDDDDDEDDDASPFEKMARNMEDISGDGGVMKKILQEGSGNVLPKGALVRVHFNGYLEYADEPFDSTRLRNAVEKFRVGEGEVITGMDIAVATMKKGELCRVIIKPDYGYGHYGCPPRIPQDAILMFEIEVLSFVDHAGVDDFNFMSEEQKREVPFVDVKKVYNAKRQEAKQLYDAKQFHRAYNLYRKGAEEATLQFISRAITHCKAALEIDKENIKALYHYGKALHQLGEFKRARDYLIRAKKQHQKQRKCDDKNINAELQKLENSMRDFDVLYKGMCQKMFSKPQGQSEEEKARSNEIIQKAEDKSMKISEEFKNLARKNLQNFVDDPDVIELPWPSLNLTVAETACIVETAEEMGLDVRQIGSGQYMKMKICKKSPIISNE
ncbi:hypothetical protein KUTeg_020500 [Tegillarca granosa]|uniref:peptidylprolyl isomerase n=1 Tax=Tegillarca granosa TaxID=220873 RepID=A0ABQ9EE24_TEGGR|nr:hypothetical protein KUTeg_020500 [Tegillarca granosa]